MKSTSHQYLDNALTVEAGKKQVNEVDDEVGEGDWENAIILI